MTSAAAPSPVVTADRLPEVIADMTPEWFTSVLQGAFPGVKVVSVEEDHIIWGTATKAMFHLSYAGEQGPSRVCVKGGFDPNMKEFGLGVAYRQEAEFFGRVAPDLSLPLPQVWFASTNLEQDQGVLLMENLEASGAVFGDCTVPFDGDQMASGLSVLAQLHGPTWNAQQRYPWLSTASPVRAVSEHLFSEGYWAEHFGGPSPEVPDKFLDREGIFAAFMKLWSIEENGNLAVSHGDTHPGNTYFAADGAVRFLDWQCLHANSIFQDVGYFIAGAQSVENRRANERDLLAHYLGELAAYGGPSLSLDDVWTEYRQHQLHGYLWAITSVKMQPIERVLAMAERHLAALEDHDTLAAIASADRTA